MECIQRTENLAQSDNDGDIEGVWENWKCAYELVIWNTWDGLGVLELVVIPRLEVLSINDDTW